jgi:hypothetical protein
MDMKTRIIVGICALVLALGVAVGVQAQTVTPSKSELPAALKSQAKISVEDARAIANKKVPGVIKEE